MSISIIKYKCSQFYLAAEFYLLLRKDDLATVSFFSLDYVFLFVRY